MGCGNSSAKSTTTKQDEEYDKAVLQVKVSRDRVKKYQNRLEADNEKEMQLAVKLAKEGKMERAKLVLKAKKARENMIIKADGMLNTLQNQLDNLEQAKLTKDFADSLQRTNAVLKDMNEKLTPEMVESLMDENAEQNEKLQEVADLLGQNISQEDEADIEAEYERMVAELNGQQNADEEPEQEEDRPRPQANKKQKVAALA